MWMTTRSRILTYAYFHNTTAPYPFWAISLIICSSCSYRIVWIVCILHTVYVNIWSNHGCGEDDVFLTHGSREPDIGISTFTIKTFPYLNVSVHFRVPFENWGCIYFSTDGKWEENWLENPAFSKARAAMAAFVGPWSPRESFTWYALRLKWFFICSIIKQNADCTDTTKHQYNFRHHYISYLDIYTVYNIYQLFSRFTLTTLYLYQLPKQGSQLIEDHSSNAGHRIEFLLVSAWDSPAATGSWLCLTLCLNSIDEYSL